MQTTECSRCLGNGWIIAFGHIIGGRCFACGGAGKVDVHPESEMNAPKAVPLPHRSFTFQGRTGTVADVRGITRIEWNGGALNMRGSEIVNFTMGIPRKIHQSIIAASKE